MTKTEEALADLKKQLHSLMNGPVSSTLRNSGLKYRTIYGVEWGRLVELAAETGKSQALAAALWKEDIRECRLLAGLVQPAELFTEDLAEIWVESMNYPEEAQYTTLSLLQHMPDASDIAFRWIADGRIMFQLCGYLILARMFMKSYSLSERESNEFLDQAESSLNAQNPSLKSAVLNALLKYSELGEEENIQAAKVLHKLHQ